METSYTHFRFLTSSTKMLKEIKFHAKNELKWIIKWNFTIFIYFTLFGNSDLNPFKTFLELANQHWIMKSGVSYSFWNGMMKK